MSSERANFIHRALDDLTSELKDHPRSSLIAVSKTYPVSDIEIAYNWGQRDFGENKVQDLLEKATLLQERCPEIRWHFIGKLQTNKINMLLKTPQLVSIHSVGSRKLLEKLLSKHLESESKIGLFLQVNTSHEEEKNGLEEESDLKELISLCHNHENFFFQGFMTIGKIRTTDFLEDARASFTKMVQLKETYQVHIEREVELSMGMSQDYKIALEYHATWLRVGSKIFGIRSI